MTKYERDGLIVAPGERGLLRVFGLAAPKEQIKKLADPKSLQALIGAEQLDATQVELFAVSDLDDMGLAGYLAVGHDIDAAQIEAVQDRLDRAEDHAVIVRSKAFGGAGMTLMPSPELTLLACLNERGIDWTAAPMDTESARPYSAPRPSPRAQRNRARRIGGIIFAGFLLLVAFVLMMVF